MRQRPRGRRKRGDLDGGVCTLRRGVEQRVPAVKVTGGRPARRGTCLGRRLQPGQAQQVGLLRGGLGHRFRGAGPVGGQHPLGQDHLDRQRQTQQPGIQRQLMRLAQQHRHITLVQLHQAQTARRLDPPDRQAVLGGALRGPAERRHRAFPIAGSGAPPQDEQGRAQRLRLAEPFGHLGRRPGEPGRVVRVTRAVGRTGDQ